MRPQYERNFPAISVEEQETLRQKHVLVLGCGGLGGYLIELLARLGVGRLTVVDGDCFEPSNQNRQLYSTPARLGRSKARTAAERVGEIAPETAVEPVMEFFTEDNADALVRGVDLVVDALDNLPARLLLEDVCDRHNVPYVHGAILGWNLQVTTGLPCSRVLHGLYGGISQQTPDDPAYKTSLSMTPAVCAGMQVAEALKLLTGRLPALAGKLLLLDLRTMEQRMITL
ncbi:HesA/MoeB/ThiF family protein [Candidatus Avoscillospira sp. LCP25S3_F1]|uniref:HesA/MoeB/ThiF family protein n=1 Tax=Candidatus Avoscillospira sp. LCP25S3_F1 TaxID=3438825 RepID=UPI003F905CA5